MLPALTESREEKLWSGNTPPNTVFLVVIPSTAQVMLHQPSGGANGMAADIQIMAEEIIKTRARLNDIYAEHTGQVCRRE